MDADVNIGGSFLAARNVELASARRAGADEHRVPALRQQRLEAVDALAADEFDAEPEDVVALFVDHALRQPEPRDLGADHAARLRVLIEDHTAVAERCEITSDRERSRAAAHQSDALAVRGRRSLGQAALDVIFVVGRDALQPTDRHRVLLDPDAPAGGLAWPIA